MPMYKEGLNIPIGYRYQLNTNPEEPREKQNWTVIRERDGRLFYATNRDFELVDRAFDHFISKSINDLVGAQAQVKVLDLAGGIGSLTADGLAEKFGKKVIVLNVDVLANRFDHAQNVYPIQGDAEYLPILSNSIDFAYSHQYAFYYRIHNDLEGEIRALNEIKRVLKPGCNAAIDELYISYAKPEKVRRYEQDLGVSFSFVNRRSLSFVDRLRFLAFNPFASPKMLIMTKPAHAD